MSIRRRFRVPEARSKRVASLPEQCATDILVINENRGNPFR
jgi:rRNA maturation protein Rpf1